MYENLKKEVELVWEDHDHIRDDQASIKTGNAAA